jgi:hypothetical protein
MPARKLKQAAAVVNQPAAPAAPAGQPNLVAAHAAIWESIGKLYGQEGRRDDLPDGFAGRIELSIAAKVEGVAQPFRQGFTVDLTAGYASQRASSTLPKVGLIVGHILGLLNAATREAVLRDLPAIYAANDGDLPDVPATVAEAAESLLAKLRASIPQKVRGSVSAKCTAGALPLSLVG